MPLQGSIARQSGNPRPEPGLVMRSGVGLGAPSSVGVPWGPSGSGRCPDTSSPSRSITVKDLKAMLPQVNYRVPNMRFLRDKLVVRPPALWGAGLRVPAAGLEPAPLSLDVPTPAPLPHTLPHRRWKPGTR